MGNLQGQNNSNNVAPNKPEEELPTAQADLVYGSSAHEALGDQEFIARWQRLYDNCPHAMAYQSPEFVRAWYHSYRAEWQPVIIRSLTGCGELQGLWLLAYDESSSKLSHAGAHQAEYHAWLAAPGHDAAFLRAAWVQIKKRLAFASLRFKYLPTAELGNVLRSSLGAEGGVSVQLHDRPLVFLDNIGSAPLCSKQSYKRRINGLKKLGAYRFQPLMRPEDLDRVIDELILFYDFRQGAVNQCSPFWEDRKKKEFLCNLFIEATDQVYVTVAYLDEQPVAAFWGNISSKTLHLGMLIYSPFLARYSLGKVHIAQLCDDLRNTGFKVLDLTPGGDAWKDSFANSHDQVAEATVYASRWRYALEVANATLLRLAKSCISKSGMNPQSAKAAMRSISHVRLAKVYRVIRTWLGSQREMRIYRCDHNLASGHSADARVRRNSLHDLLCFEAVEPWQKRTEFLSEAYASFERGELAYTVCIGDRLAHYGWMVVGQTDSFVTEVKQPIVYPPDSATLYGFYSVPAFRGQGLYRASIATMLSDAFADGRVQQVFISVLADNAPSRHVIETMGFKYVGSAHWRSRWGRETRWVDPLLSRSSVRTPEQERSEQLSPE